MEEEIRLMDIKALQEYSRQDSCIDDYLFMTDRLENMLAGEKSARTKVFLMIYCTRGEVNLELNNKSYRLQTDDLLVGLPNTFIGKILASPDYQVKIICLSGRFIQRSHRQRNTPGSLSTTCTGIPSNISVKRRKVFSVCI